MKEMVPSNLKHLKNNFYTRAVKYKHINITNNTKLTNAAPRCKYAARVGGACEVQMPELLPVSTSSAHQVRCHLDLNNRETIFTNEVKPFL